MLISQLVQVSQKLDLFIMIPTKMKSPKTWPSFWSSSLKSILNYKEKISTSLEKVMLDTTFLQFLTIWFSNIKMTSNWISKVWLSEMDLLILTINTQLMIHLLMRTNSLVLPSTKFWKEDSKDVKHLFQLKFGQLL